MTKDELLASIRGDRGTLDALVSSLNAARMVAPELEAGWSVKDVLAHISAWEQLCLKWVRSGQREEASFTQASIDAFNDGIFEANHDRALGLIRLESGRSYEQMLETVEGLASDLDSPPSWASPEFAGGAASASLGQIISSNSDEHYREHIEQIRRWLERPA